MWSVVVFLASGFAVAQTEGEPKPVSKWEAAIQAFEKQDQQMPPVKDGVLFVGSSTIRLWDVKKFFSALPVLNRGFGGSQTADVLEFADRIVIPYAPRVIVFYSGDNDIAHGMTAEAVFKDYERLFALVRQKLPETTLIVIGIKPCAARWKFIETVRAVNGMVEQACKDQPLRVFVSTEPMVMGEDGKPRPDLFMEDQLHLNSAAYAKLSELIRPLITEALAPKQG